MDKVIKIILSILLGLALFLAGWFANAWKNRDEVRKQVKQAIKDLSKQHKEALKSLRKEGSDKIETKDKIIKDLNLIIERLLNLLHEKDEKGTSLFVSDKGANKLAVFLDNKLMELDKISKSSHKN